MKKTVDATGLACPLPVIETRKALKEMSAGVLEVIVDNVVSLQNLEKMAKQMDLIHRLETTSDDQHSIYITVDETTGEAQDTERQESPASAGTTVVVLSSDTMGSGDDKLGRVLMKGFVYALTELDRLPDRVLLYNSAVRLSVQGSDSLADLQKLAEQGVEILNCGTCLNFYNLGEELRVGSVTNMYEIVQSQMEATSIIRP
ncbi:MAG: sulfurtransferase-like selenium metabolism protein YedF [Limnochordia bacterium]|jgi:selenium metabolism protein YedF|nr:sulfurtransferase-like selenium metabolism protein YedF [Limnochordia bacterium]